MTKTLAVVHVASGRRRPRCSSDGTRQRCALALAVLLGIVAPSVSYGQAWSGVVETVPGSHSDAQRRPGVVGDAAGNVMAVWWRGAPDGIEAARYDAATGVWSAPVTLASNVRPELFPLVAGDGAGNVVAVWTTTRAADNAVHYARYSASSGTWTAAQPLVQAGPTFEVRDLALAWNANGEVFATWIRSQAGWGEGTTYVARYTTAAGTWSSPAVLPSTNAASRPQLAVNDAGQAMALWVDVPSSRFATYDTATASWIPGAELPALTRSDARLALDGSGNATAVWVEQTSVKVLKGMHYSSATSTWGTPVTLSPPDHWLLWFEVVGVASGDVYVISEFQEYPNTRTRYGIATNVYRRANLSWTGTEELVRDSWAHTRPKIAVDAAGALTAVWGVANDLSPACLLASRRAPGATWDTPIVVRRCFDPWDSASLAPALPVDGVGNVSVVWSHFASPASGYRIESTRWLANGVPPPPTGVPGAPRNLQATVTGTTVGLTWTPPSSGGTPTGYSLVGRLTAGGQVLATVPMGAGTSFALAAPDGTFVLSVQASNAAGAGPESNSVTVTVPQAPSPPGSPSNLTATVAGSTVTVTWDAPSSGGPVGNYVLLAGLTPGFTVPFATVPLGAVPGLVAPGVPVGTYYLRVVAQNAGGTSPPTNEASFTIAGAVPPGAPTLHPPLVSGGTVTLSWSAGTGGTPTGYTLSASATPGGAPIASVPLSGSGVSFSGVPGGTYYLRLVASNAAGTSPPSSEVTLVVQ